MAVKKKKTGAKKKVVGRPFTSENQPSGNHKRLPEDLQHAVNLTKLQFKGLVNKHLWMNAVESKEIAENPKTPMLELMIASIVQKAVVHGDERRLTFILDRIIGKPVEQIDIKTYVTKLKEMSEDQIITLGAEAVKFLEKGKE